MLKPQEKRWEEMQKLDMPMLQVFDDYAGDLRIQRKSPKTIVFYLKNLQAFLKWLRKHGYQGLLGDFNLATVKRYVFYLEYEHHRFEGHPYTPERDENLSPFSVRAHVRTVKAFSSWLEREEYLSDNVLVRLRLPKAPKIDIKVLTEDEIKAVLSSVNQNISSGARKYAILLLMLDSGLRLGEVVRLKLSKVDFEHGQMWVDGKGDKERVVPMGSTSQRYLRRYVAHFRPEPIRPQIDIVFLSLDGRPITENSVKLIFSRLSSRCKIPRLHAHLCRHTFGTNYLRNGGDVFSLQKILGHEDLSTVKLYMHLVDADVVKKHRLYSPIDSLDLPRSNGHRPVKKNKTSKHR